MKNTILGCVAALLAGAVGCGSGNAKVDRAIHGSQRILDSDSTLESVRLKTSGNDPNLRGKSFSEWPALSAPVSIDDASARELLGILTRADSYYTGSPKACIMTPGVKVVAGQGGSVGEIYFCFECLMLSVEPTGGRGAVVDFDPSGSRLAAVFKRLYPQDPVIQALK